MSNKDRKAEKRKKLLNERSQKQRTAVQREDGKTTIIRQGTTKGYDVQMVRDFLEHLLLEVRVQHFENVKALRALDATGRMEQAVKAAAEPSEKITEQFKTYQQRYATCLLAANAIDGKNASDEEVQGVAKVLLERNIEKRDVQIGHLEALQDLFDEALACAKLPFGLDKDGNFVQPQNVHPVREIVDGARRADLPVYDDLLPLFASHAMATESGIEQLKKAKIIVATSDTQDAPLVLIGADEVERLKKLGSDNVQVLPIPVESFQELQFVIAAINKFVGPPDTDGEPWRDM